MNIDLSGKTALVTGSTGGIGFRGRARPGACGARVAVTGASRNGGCGPGKIKKTLPKAKLRGGGGCLHRGGCARLAATVPEPYPGQQRRDLRAQDFFAIPDEDWRRFFEVNVLSGVRLSRALMPGMLKRDWGRIVFVSSNRRSTSPRNMIHYAPPRPRSSPSPAALPSSTAGTGVTVNAVLPGPTRSDGIEPFLEAMAARKACRWTRWPPNS